MSIIDLLGNALGGGALGVGGAINVGGAATFSGAVAIGNTVNTVSPTSPNRTVTMAIMVAVTTGVFIGLLCLLFSQ